MKFKILFLSLCTTFSLNAQQNSVDFDSLLTESLVNGKSYEYLTTLCKDIGNRLSGSANAEKAVQWGKQTLDEIGFDRVYLQPVMVPHWERGDIEKATLQPSNLALKVKALGGTIGTNGGKISGELVVVNSFTQLDELGKSGQLLGKIVLFNQPMNPGFKDTFMAYSMAVGQRSDGAWKAAQYGAKAVLVRSLTLMKDAFPHTGGMRYKDSIPQIPALAISTQDADMIQKRQLSGEKQSIDVALSAKWFEDAPSFNVIAEWTGSEKPKEIISVGGHLDSWDVGEGAHDDGAGIVHSIESLRLLKTMGYKPKHTMRVVLFMNEENGVRGGEKYAEEAQQLGENHIAAIESDRGGFAPVAFSIDAPQKRVDELNSLKKPLSTLGISDIYQGYGGVDIGKLKAFYPEMLLIGFVPDNQRYFNYHHADTDVLEAVNERELKMGAAAIAGMLYLLDQKL